MKKLFLLIILFYICGNTYAQDGNHQPYANYWFPASLLTWSPTTDTAAPFNRGRVPLATRFVDVPSSPCTSTKSTAVKLASLAITNAHTSGNPSQGYDHAGEYDFGFWQYIDYFVMWGGSAGEGLILAPNATWIDAGHRNGVKVFGTIFMPPTVYGGTVQWLNDLLQTDVNGNYPVADKLIQVASYYGFDGWFINQETDGGTAANGASMIKFMKYFQQHKPAGMEIMWYDAMIPSGAISYQNQLNNTNARMFEDTVTVSNSMFLNFNWSSTGLTNSATKATSLTRNPFDVYAGIDVQANGSGTNVNWASIFPTVSTPKVSVGLYIPSWTFQSSPDQNDISLFYQREMGFWIGANNNPCNAPASGWPGLAKYYPEKSVISAWPFITHFNTGQGTNGFWIDGKLVSSKPWNNQSAQDILPTWRWISQGSGTPLSVDFDFADAYNGGNSIKVSGALSSANATTIKLYNTKMAVTSSSVLSVTFKQGFAGASNMQAAVAFTDAPTTYINIDCGPTTAGWTTKNINLSAYQGKTLCAVGLYFSSTTTVSNYSMNIGEISLLNTTATASNPASNLNIVAYTDCENAELDVTYDTSSSGDIWYYDILRINPDNSTQWLGRTPNNAFYVKNIKRLANETTTTIAIVAVNKSGASSTQLTKAFAWPQTPNYALSLNGVNKYVNAGIVNLSGNAVTLEGWVNMSGVKANTPFVSGVMGIEDTGQNTALLRIGDVSIGSNKPEFVVNIAGTLQTLSATAALSTGAWHHIAATYDGSNMKLYIDNQLNNTKAATGTVKANGTFYIGRNAADSSCFSGLVDEMRAWTTALSDTDITNEQCYTIANSNGLEGHWTFNDCGGLVVYDAANEHNGTPANMTAADWVTQTPCSPLGVSVVNDLKNIKVIPNPVQRGGSLLIELPSGSKADCYIYSATGNMVHSESIEKKQTSISIDRFAPGIYFYKVICNNQIYTGKIVVL